MKFIVISFLFFSSIVHAGIWHTFKIDLIYLLENGNLVVGLTTEHLSCKNANGFYRVYLGEYGVTVEGANKIYSAIIAAASQKKEVEINFDANVGQCYINRVKTFY